MLSTWFPFTPDESSPPSASGMTPGDDDADHVQHPLRRQSPSATALQCYVDLTSVFNTVSNFWG